MFEFPIDKIQRKGYTCTCTFLHDVTITIEKFRHDVYSLSQE